MALISSETANKFINEQKTKSLEIEKTILESFVIISNVSMSTSHIFQYVKRKHPYVTPHQVKDALAALEGRRLLAPANYSLHNRIYPVRSFIGKCTLRHIRDEMGTGYVLTEDLEEGEEIFPSKIHAGWIPPGDFVIWYNN